MKKVIIVLIAITASFAGMAQESKTEKNTAKTTTVQKGTYSCPMHPNEVSNKPGKCSTCGMDLTKSKKEQMKMEVMKMYACPMHPNQTFDKPGKCADCGMDMTVVKTKTKAKKG